MKKLGIILATILVAVIAAGVLARTLLYPMKDKTIINKYAKEYKVDAALIASVIHFETGFESIPYEEGKSVGYMKLKPEVAIKLAKEANIADFKPEKTAEEDTNIKLGTYFISKHYKNNDIKELMSDWQERNGKDKDAKVDMRDYVKQYYAPKIEKRMKIYKVLYPTLK
ncbi:transglycosylase SLT domain-containing protein [Hathewaya histolytica]|uniref:transglycosylase SLT domain-containing protein n=1 Tax=Hathewaya histolytica TaxID=1498 RepID=UPI003B67DFC3